MVKSRGLIALSALSLLAVSSASHAALSSYADDFSGYGGQPTMAPNWGGFSDNCGFPGGYSFAPSTSGPQISAIASDGGNDFWNVYGNYDNAACQNGTGPNTGQGENLSLFVQQTFDGAEAAGGGTWTFEFDYREADVPPAGSTTVSAFIRVFDGVFNLLDEQTLDTSGASGGAFQAGLLSQTLSAAWSSGGIIQFGFANQVVNFEDSGMNYDNVCWSNDGGASCAAPIPVPAAVWLFGSALGLLGWSRRRITA